MRIGLSGDIHTIYHVTNAVDNTARSTFNEIFDHAGLPAPRFVDTPDQPTERDRTLARIIDFDLPYVRENRTFDRTNSTAILGDKAMTRNPHWRSATRTDFHRDRVDGGAGCVIN